MGGAVILRRPSGGFTLIELVLVITLIGIITALTAPRFRNTVSSFRLKNAAFDLYKMAQFARERALAENRPFRLHFDFNQNSYRLLQGPDFKPIQGRFGRNMKISDELTLKGSLEDLTCYPDGSCEGEPVRIQGSEGAYEISLAGLGGLVRVHEVE